MERFVSRHAVERKGRQASSKTYRLNPVDAPLSYFDGTLYHPVSPVSLIDTSTNKAGGILLRNKNVSTIGTKKLDDAYKFIGFRPDNRQNGDVQLEFSIESIEIDGKNVSIDLSKNEQITDYAINLESLVVKTERNGCRILIPCSRDAGGFKITFRAHTKGLNVMYRPRTDVWAMQEFSTGELKYRLRPPQFVDTITMRPIKNKGLIKHSMTDLGGGEYRYVKESTALFASAEVRAALPEIFYIDASVSYSTYGAALLAVGGNSSWETAHEKPVADDTDYSSSTWDLGCYISSGDPYLYRVALQYDSSGIPSGNVIEVSENVTFTSGLPTMAYISQEFFSYDVCYSIDGYQKFLGEMFGSSAPTSKPLFYNQLGRDYIASRLKAELLIQTMLREAYDYKNFDPAGDMQVSGQENSHVATMYSPYSEGNEPYLEITLGTSACAFPFGG